MGMDLVRGSTEFSIHASTWGTLLHIAEANGWTPAGTLAPHWWPGDRAWRGGYLSNDYQVVTEGDALIEVQATAEGAVFAEEDLLRLLRLARIGCADIFAAQARAVAS